VDFVHPVQAVIPGAEGRVLAVLAQTTAPLNLSTLARLAGVSVAQASRVMPGLVDLGLVERGEIPPPSHWYMRFLHTTATQGGRRLVTERTAGSSIDPTVPGIGVTAQANRQASPGSSPRSGPASRVLR